VSDTLRSPNRLSEEVKAQVVSEEKENSLAHALSDYLEWMISSGYAESGLKAYEKILKRFLCFVREKGIAWDDIFTWDTLRAFQGRKPTTEINRVLKKFARYLFEHKKIQRSLKGQYYKLPEIYEQYVAYYEKTHQVSSGKMISIQRVLSAFNEYLENSNIKLPRIHIEQIDTFLAEFTKPFKQSTCRLYRSYLRGFLSYLYHQKRILRRDLAPLVVGAPQFAQAIPPKFLRPEEVRRLFCRVSQNLSSKRELRTYAMFHLAYFLGLRPREISMITLDDLSFTRGELSSTRRKNNNPLTLPLPEETLKALSAYLMGGRPKSKHRNLFLALKAPFIPVTPATVSYWISTSMRELNLSSTAYWLRHTYAQNLLESGRSLYETKEMLGHTSIESTRRYLHIHINLMRKVLFDETV
jgi:site-specific recombinase XerD